MRLMLILFPLFFLSACQICFIGCPFYPYDDSREKDHTAYYPPFMYKDSSVTIKAAEEGNRNAQFDLGVMYRNGYGVKKDDKKAVEWWTKSAEQDHPRAQLYLGRMYDQGYGVIKDQKMAKDLYEKAADQGDAYAQYYLGGGVSCTGPIFWMTKAAEQGVVVAQRCLAERYKLDGRSRNKRKYYSEAVYWFTKAAEQGDMSAVDQLGYMYYQGGQGLQKNNLEAYVWLSIYQLDEQRSELIAANYDQNSTTIVNDSKLEPVRLHAGSSPTENIVGEEEEKKETKPESRADIINSIFSSLTEPEKQKVNLRIKKIDEKIEQNSCRNKEAWEVFTVKTPLGRCSVGEDL